ncbi:PepSY-like domain-containing protein [Alistipes putredinis]|jgi:hypothetical protein|uniref:PepSY-like domain-containing protein n=1 Tax=Alistipes putredinis TaxID=28117 RepID=UPI003AB8A7E3
MKKLVVLFVSMLVLATTASAGNDKPIQVSQLPQTAQQFIKKYFGDRKVAFAKEESDFRKSYEIAFTTGDKIEFDRKGEWTDIDCKYSAVPAGIVPAQIVAYIAENYPDSQVVQIEKDSRSTEVKLDNRMEIKFDKQYRVIEMDF